MTSIPQFSWEYFTSAMNPQISRIPLTPAYLAFRADKRLPGAPVPETSLAVRSLSDDTTRIALGRLGSAFRAGGPIPHRYGVVNG
jgi:hypothetical protein